MVNSFDGPTRGQVLRMAMEAGFELSGGDVITGSIHGADVITHDLERFAVMVSAVAAYQARQDYEAEHARRSVPMCQVGRVKCALIDALVGDPLTGRKAADICEREGYDVTGVVMTRVAKEGDDFTGVQRCIVNLGAVRWFFDGGTWQEIMFPENQPARVTEAVADKREACAKVFDARNLGDHGREDLEARNCAAAFEAGYTPLSDGEFTTDQVSVAKAMDRAWSAFQYEWPGGPFEVDAALASRDAEIERLRAKLDENAMPDDYILIADQLTSEQLEKNRLRDAINLMLRDKWHWEEIAVKAVGPATQAAVSPALARYGIDAPDEAQYCAAAIRASGQK